MPMTYLKVWSILPKRRRWGEGREEEDDDEINLSSWANKMTEHSMSAEGGHQDSHGSYEATKTGRKRAHIYACIDACMWTLQL